MNLEQRLSELEAHVSRLEKAAAAATAADRIIASIHNVIQKYLDFQIKVLTALEKGETADQNAIYAANGSISC